MKNSVKEPEVSADASAMHWWDVRSRHVGACALLAASVVASLVPSTTAVATMAPAHLPVNETVTSFRDGSVDAARAAIYQPDAKLIIVGTAGGDFGVHREQAGGLADPEFSDDGWATTDFGAGDGANAVALDASGAIFAVGWTGGDVALVRYDSGGTLDRSFGADGRVVIDLGGRDDAAYGAVVDGAGRLTVAGGNSSAMVVLRFTPAGTPDSTFGQAGQVRLPSDGPARALVLTPNGDVVAAGGGGAAGFHIVALRPDGSADPAFGTAGAVRVPLGAPANAVGIEVLVDGRLVVGGERSGDMALTRLSSSGVLDPSYGTAGVVVTDLGRVEHPHGVTVAPDGSAFVTGDAGPRWGFIASYLANGSLDTRFRGTGSVEVEGSEWWKSTPRPADNSGWITVGTWGGDYSAQHWAAVGATGVVDTMWDASHIIERAYGTARYPDGRWIVLADTSGMIGLVRYMADGTLDRSFGRNGVVTSDLALRPRGVVLQSTGRIVVAGQRQHDAALVAFRPDGSLDRAWGTDAGRTITDTGTAWVESPEALDLLANDVISLIGNDGRGTFLAHYRPDGTPDPSFGRGGLVVSAATDARLRTDGSGTARQPDGKLLVAGDLTVRRYNFDGTLDTGFAVGGKLTVGKPTFWPGGNIRAIALLPDGRFLLGERYEGGPFGFAIARYNPDGSVDKSFATVHTEFIDSADPTAQVGTGSVLDFVLFPDGRFLAASGAQFARYMPDGGLDPSFGEGGRLFLGRTLGSVAVDFVIKAAMAADGTLTLIGSGKLWAPGSGVKIARYAAAPLGGATVQAWGWNGVGGLGIGGTVDHATPAAVASLPNVVDIAADVFHSMALRADGTVWAWGWNSFGQLGDGTTVDRHTPVQVPGLTDVVEVSAGAYHSLALKRDGTVWAWGSNVVGQLGDSTTVDRHLPVHVVLPGGITAISAGGYHSLAVEGGQSLVAWGWNAYGQLGDGTTIDRHEYVPVARLDWIHYEAVSAGTYHSVAIRSEGGAIQAWGWNGYGQLGDGTTVERHLPAHVQAPLGFVSLSAGGLHTLARNVDGSVWAWGSNAVGQLGDGTTVDRHVPARIPGLTALDVSAGLFHSAAVTTGGVVMAWGWNVLGQLGNGTTVDRPRPTAVAGVPPAAVVAAGGIETMAR